MSIYTKNREKVQYGYIDTLKKRKKVQYGTFLGSLLAINSIFNPVNNNVLMFSFEGLTRLTPAK